MMFFDPCSIEIQELNPGTLVSISGVIDESAALRELTSKLKAPIVIDLGDVTFINSFGLREWMYFLRAVARPVTLRRCAVPMVLQFNMVDRAFEGARIESFSSPYECESCGFEKTELLDVESFFRSGRSKAPPVKVCPECKGRMILAEMPERYLAFLDNLPSSGSTREP